MIIRKAIFLVLFSLAIAQNGYGMENNNPEEGRQEVAPEAPNTDLIHQLLQAGADLSQRDDNHFRPLVMLMLVTNNPTEMIQLLINYNADPNINDNGHHNYHVNLQNNHRAMEDPIEHNELPVISAYLVPENESSDSKKSGVSQGDQTLSKNTECPICLNDYETNDELIVFDCRHSYCQPCYERCMNTQREGNYGNYEQQAGLQSSQTKCGICREKIDKNKLKRVKISEKNKALDNLYDDE